MNLGKPVRTVLLPRRLDTPPLLVADWPQAQAPHGAYQLAELEEIEGHCAIEEATSCTATRP